MLSKGCGAVGPGQWLVFVILSVCSLPQQVLKIVRCDEAEKRESMCGTDHAMQLVEYFEIAHITSAAFWRESGRVFRGTNLFQSVIGNWHHPDCSSLQRLLKSATGILCLQLAMMKEAPFLLRTVAYVIPSRVNARARWTFIRRINAEGAIEPPDIVLIANYRESRSCWVWHVSAR